MSEFDDEQIQQVRQKVLEYLIESGERDKIMLQLRTKLREKGWNKQVQGLCNETIQEVGVQKIDMDTLTEQVIPKAIGLVPSDVKRDIKHQLEAIIAAQFNS